MSRPLRLRAVFFLMTNAVMWALGPIFVKYFTGFYNPWTQNAFRYSCAAGILFCVGMIRGKPLFALSRADWGKLVLAALPNLILQCIFAVTYYFIYPSIASLIHRTTVIFVIGFSFLFFHEERNVIRSPRFLIGAGLTLFGVIAVAMGQNPEVLQRLDVSRSAFWIGVSLSFAYAFFLAIYTVTIKHLVRNVDPLVSFTHVSWMTAAGLVVVMLCAGGVSDLWTQPVHPLFLMALSALLCIVIAHTAYFAALREVSAVVSVSVTQLVPVFTCAISAAVYADVLSVPQILGGLVAIGGAWMAGLAEARLVRKTPPL